MEGRAGSVEVAPPYILGNWDRPKVGRSFFCLHSVFILQSLTLVARSVIVVLHQGGRVRYSTPNQASMMNRFLGCLDANNQQFVISHGLLGPEVRRFDLSGKTVSRKGERVYRGSSWDDCKEWVIGNATRKFERVYKGTPGSEIPN